MGSTPRGFYPNGRKESFGCRPGRTATCCSARTMIIEEVEGRVAVIDYADRLTGPLGLRRVETTEGTRWIGQCPIKPHASRIPTFVVDPRANYWCCSACGAGGDVVDLAAAVARCDARSAAQLLFDIYLCDARSA